MNELGYTLGIAVNHDGTVFIADWVNHRVQQFSIAHASGAKHGGTGGGVFDDKLDTLKNSASCSFHLSGIVPTVKNENSLLTSLPFVYSKSSFHHTVTSPTRGNPVNVRTYEQFTLNKDNSERINKITGVIDTVYSLQMITGIQFHTTTGRSSRWYGRTRGTTKFSEQFEGSTVEHVTGRSGDFVDELQFY